MASDEQLHDWHDSGVHVHCHQSRTRTGDDTWRNCLKAGAVERFHAHDFDGPLVCGCEDLYYG